MLILILICAPTLFALLTYFLRRTGFGRAMAAAGAAMNLCAVIWLLLVGYAEGAMTLPYLGVCAFVAGPWARLLLAAAALSFLLTMLYTLSFYRGKLEGDLYLPLFLLSLSLLNGALLCDDLFLMLFFWEGLLCTMTGMLLLHGMRHPKTAVKALTVSGTADLLLMLGIICTVKAAGTSSLSGISGLPVSGVGAWGCVCMLLGAMGKAGVMPFHSWIPSAAEDAPTPFMAAFPGSLEKILGIYLTVRLVTGLYDVQPGGPVSTFICVLGAVTLFLGVGLALVQKDMKRLLACHAVSQVGYMLLGIGTALPVGIVGGVFHMFNNVLYKSGLFIAAGAVEWRTGTTDLHHLGGLGRKMPVTAVCFLLFGLSIAGFPGTNGFFSKELIFDAALETGFVWYLIALVGAFMTAASFLKMTRAAFFGGEKLPQGCLNVREAGAGFTLPLCLLAALCLGLGVFSRFPIDTVIGRSLGIADHFGGWAHCAPVLVAVSCGVLALAVLDHIYGSRRDGGALNAVDHIHYAPVLRRIYAWAEVGLTDPYNWFVSLIVTFSKVCIRVEAGVSWLCDKAIPALVEGAGEALHRAANGNLSRYLLYALGGVVLVGLTFLAVML